jgi:[FeFe] hydrogenase H-cluster maturation GTPase HydF
MKSVPKGERMNICFIGRMNVGKSSIINKLTEQDISIVSEQPGTTTDPVVKRYELIPVGPVTIYDTAGYVDNTALGKKRIKTTMQVIFRSDLAIVVLDNYGLEDIDIFYIKKLVELNIPYILVWNKADISLMDKKTADFVLERKRDIVYCSMPADDLGNLKDEIISNILNLRSEEHYIIKDLVNKNDVIVLVIPIDESAPKGRVILPQVQVLREALDCNAIAICCTEKELAKTLKTLKSPPQLVITDSQAIEKVSKIVPESVYLTTFSTLFARYKGDLSILYEGIKAFKEIKPDDKILISEACSHHTMSDDIGTVKLPNWIKKKLGFSPEIHKVGGHDFPADLESYKLVIHCGACMMTRMEMLRRINECARRGVAITNYGLMISELSGNLDRVIKIFNNTGKR